MAHPLPPTQASQTLASAFCKALGLPQDFDVIGLAYRQHKAWDSVAHMQLVAEIEAAFGIMLDTDDVIGMNSYAAAVAILKKQGVNADAP